jgi:hypothetical protein
MRVLGIDPGKGGGFALLTGLSTPPFTWCMPATPGDMTKLFEELAYLKITAAYLEKTHSMPKQGVASAHTFGENRGALRQALSDFHISTTQVPPGVWQRALGCLSHGDKNVTKGRAQELYPNVVMTHAIADALLIATYGWKQECLATTANDTRRP